MRGVVLVFRDVRAERAAQLKLQESEAKYRDLYENSPDLYALVSLAPPRIEGVAWQASFAQQALGLIETDGDRHGEANQQEASLAQEDVEEERVQPSRVARPEGQASFAFEAHVAS